MTINVLIVDDSSFLLQQIQKIIDVQPDMKVIAKAVNGQQALELAQQLKPDVITMDYEMPVMDGITAVRHIMQDCPTPILMFSSMTHEGAQITFDALQAGAVDFLSKSFEGVSAEHSLLRQMLVDKIRALNKSRTQDTSESVKIKKSKVPPKRAIPETLCSPEVILIGTSTGGPVAVQKVISNIKNGFSIPIIVIQHMPSTFTGAFAQRLSRITNNQVCEAQDGMLIKPGVILVAPGGKQMMIKSNQQISIIEGEQRLHYKPCIDLTFASAAAAGFSKVLAIVLTGMGSDGKKGSQMLKEKGANIWAQSAESCVIDGMPKAVVNAGIVDEVMDLDAIADQINRLV